MDERGAVMSRRLRIVLRFLVCGFIAGGAIFLGSNASTSRVHGLLLAAGYLTTRTIGFHPEFPVPATSLASKLALAHTPLHFLATISAILLPTTRQASCVFGTAASRSMVPRPGGAAPGRSA